MGNVPPCGISGWSLINVTQQPETTGDLQIAMDHPTAPVHMKQTPKNHGFIGDSSTHMTGTSQNKIGIFF
jgi:hypothetical protein